MMKQINQRQTIKQLLDDPQKNLIRFSCILSICVILATLFALFFIKYPARAKYNVFIKTNPNLIANPAELRPIMEFDMSDAQGIKLSPAQLVNVSFDRFPFEKYGMIYAKVLGIEKRKDLDVQRVYLSEPFAFRTKMKLPVSDGESGIVNIDLGSNLLYKRIFRFK
jgi:hypothetical protein